MYNKYVTRECSSLFAYVDVWTETHLSEEPYFWASDRFEKVLVLVQLTYYFEHKYIFAYINTKLFILALFG